MGTHRRRAPDPKSFGWWAIAPLLGATPALADDEALELSASMRLRYELISNQPRVGFNRDDDLLSLRTVIGARYETGPVALVAELWDSRAYLAEPGTPVTTGEVNAVELVQAHAAVDIELGPETNAVVRAGRFMLNIASRRLVAADEYRNTTSGYTGLNAEIAGRDGLTASLIYVLPQQRLPDDAGGLRSNKIVPDREGFDLVLWGGTIARPRTIGPLTLEATYYHLGERDRLSRRTLDRSLNTYGGRIFLEPEPRRFDVEVEGFHQSGRISTSTAPGAPKVPVSASFVHIDVGYTFGLPWQPRLSLEFDRASGDAPGGRYTRFDTLFGMRRADLSPSGIFAAIGRTNMTAPGARVEITPSKRIDAHLSYRAAWATEATDAFSTTGVRDPTGRSGSFAGHLIDTRLRWWVLPSRLRFEFNGVLLAKGRLLREAPNAPAGGTTAYGSFSLAATL